MSNLNLDMLYYVKNMPQFQRVKDVDYNVGNYTSAIEYLFEEEEQDASFYTPNRDFIGGSDDKSEQFTKKLKQNWGEEESQLRTAIYISFAFFNSCWDGCQLCIKGLGIKMKCHFYRLL